MLEWWKFISKMVYDTLGRCIYEKTRALRYSLKCSSIFIEYWHTRLEFIAIILLASWTVRNCESFCSNDNILACTSVKFTIQIVRKLVVNTIQRTLCQKSSEKNPRDSPDQPRTSWRCPRKWPELCKSSRIFCNL